MMLTSTGCWYKIALYCAHVCDIVMVEDFSHLFAVCRKIFQWHLWQYIVSLCMRQLT